MKKLITIFALSIAVMSFAAQAQNRIATVKTAYVLAKAPQNESIKQRLKSQFSGRENEIKRLAETIKRERDNLVKNAATMSETQLTNKRRQLEQKVSNLQLKQRNASDDFALAQREEQKKLGSAVKKAIDKVAARGGYNLIIDRQAAVYTNGSIPDVTDQVLAELK